MARFSKKEAPRSTNARATKENKLGTQDSIGKSGNTQGEQSTEGGQYPFMPDCSSYSGARDRSYTPGQTGTTDKENYDFLPDRVKPIK